MPLAAHHKKHFERGLAAPVIVIAFASSGVYWQFVREAVPVANCGGNSGATTSPGVGAAAPCP